MKFNKELEAKLAKLAPTERKRVLAVGQRMAKQSLAKMLDLLAARHPQSSTSHCTPRQNSDGETLH